MQSSDSEIVNLRKGKFGILTKIEEMCIKVIKNIDTNNKRTNKSNKKKKGGIEI